MSNFETGALNPILAVPSSDFVVVQDTAGTLQKISAPACDEYLGYVAGGKWGKRKAIQTFRQVVLGGNSAPMDSRLNLDVHIQQAPPTYLNPDTTPSNVVKNAIIYPVAATYTFTNTYDCAVNVNLVIGFYLSSNSSGVGAVQFPYTTGDKGTMYFNVNAAPGALVTTGVTAQAGTFSYNFTLPYDFTTTPLGVQILTINDGFSNELNLTVQPGGTITYRPSIWMVTHTLNNTMPSGILRTWRNNFIITERVTKI